MKNRNLQLTLTCLFLVATLNICATGSNVVHLVPDDKKLVLLVENFQNNSVEGAKWDPWKFGLATLIQDDLIQAGYFKVVSEESRYKALQEQSLGLSGLMDDSTAVKLGNLLGAKWILAGNYMVNGDQLFISSRFIDVKTSRLVASSQKTGKFNEFFDVAKFVSVNIMRQVKLDITDNDVKIISAAVETKSIEASLLNYSGEFAISKMEALKMQKKSGKDVEREIGELRNHARDDFSKAVKADPRYERAKENLSKLTIMFPSSI